MSLLPLAFNTLRETIRDKVLYVILVFALLMIGSGTLLSNLSLNQQGKVVLDLGLSAISVFGLIITIFVGTNLLNKEIDKKTIYLILSKPIRRSDFIIGKFLGLSLTLGVITLAMSVAFYFMLWYTLNALGQDMLAWVPTSAMALGLIYVEMLLLTAAAIFFSTFSTPVMSALFTLALYLIGHMSYDILQFGKLTGRPLLVQLTQILFYVLPDLERLNLKNVLIQQAVPMNIFGSALAYGGLYIAGLLILSMMIFEGKEF